MMPPRILARSSRAISVTIVYGGGKSGSMGALADAALAEGGRVIGVLPRFMDEVEWGHQRLSELILVNDMHERKRLMIQEVDAVIALPGAMRNLGGTLRSDELQAARASIAGPIVIVNTNQYYAPMLEMLDRSVEYHFMDERHRAMWVVVEEPEQVLDAIRNSPPWSAANRSFAAI